jgi:type IV pilus assembly protein PilA
VTAPYLRAGGGRRVDAGFTIIELLIVLALIVIIAAFAVPRLLRARLAGNEAGAIASLRAISTAEDLYAKSCGQGAFAASLPVLGAAPPGSTAAFLSPDLTSGVSPQHSGYIFTVQPGAGSVAGPNDCNGTPTATSFYASAKPATFGGTGNRSFATNADHTIWQIAAGAPPPEPFGPPAAPLQ